MTNEMLLLTALCEALGFDVDRKVEATKGTEVRTLDHIPTWGNALFPDWDECEFIGDGKYRQVIRETSYSLTPKNTRPQEVEQPG